MGKKILLNILVLLNLSAYSAVAVTMSEAYDNMYDDGNAIYKTRWQEGTYGPTRSERKLILNRISQISNESNKIKIVDFGAGDGRLFKAIESVAKKYPNKEVELIAYDISKTGLEVFEKDLLTRGFKKDNDFVDKGYDFPRVLKDNLSVLFAAPKDSQDISELSIIFGDGVDLVFFAYGVLNHIPGHDNRVGVLSQLKTSLNPGGEVVVIGATKNNFVNYLETYNKLRAEKKYDELGEATEPGDVYFKLDHRYDGRMFYHVFNLQELRDTLSAAGFKLVDNGVMYRFSPNMILKNKFYDFKESLISSFLSFKMITDSYKERRAAYIYAVGKAQ